MSEKKNVQELIDSIHRLINEARKEYENVITENNKLKQNESVKLHKEKDIFEHTLKYKKNSVHADWSKKKFGQTNYNNKKLILSNDNKFVTYNKRFNILMKSWIQENLNSIIEREFSLFIKNKN